MLKRKFHYLGVCLVIASLWIFFNVQVTHACSPLIPGSCTNDNDTSGGSNVGKVINDVYAIENALEIGDGGVAIRSGPGKEYTVIAVMSEADRVTVVGRNEYDARGFSCKKQVNSRGEVIEERAEYNLKAWLQVELIAAKRGYFTGWVNLCMVEWDDKSIDDSQLTVRKPRCAKTVEEDEVPVLKETLPENQMEIADSDLAFIGAVTSRMREDYGSCENQIARIRQGEMVQTIDAFTENDQDWVKIRYQNLEGWVLRNELVVDRWNTLLNQAQTVR